MVDSIPHDCKSCGRIFPANTLALTPLVTVYGNQFTWAKMCPECRQRQLAGIERISIMWLIRTFNEWPTL